MNYVSCVLFGNKIDYLSKFGKGAFISVNGRLQITKGEKNTNHTVIINDYQVVSTSPKANNNNNNNNNETDDLELDEYPF